MLVFIIIFIVSYYRTNTTLANAEYIDVVADTHEVPGYRGGSAEKRGRFIPCRGGGTATTYYTDQHNVDEDLRTISNYGDAWAMGNWAGVTRRTMNDSPTTTLDDAASRLIYLS